MIEYPSTDPTRMMTFVSAKPGFGAVVFGGIVAIFLIITVTTGKLDTVATPGNAAGTVVVLTFFASIFLLAVTRRWTAEVDLALRRLKISRRSLAGRTKVVVDCPFDECSKLGTIEYNTDGHVSYGVYVELKRGTRHAIPLQTSTFNEAAKVASELTAATGIPRLDTRF